mmetsp:Transcript_12655/g.22988  ORF Transcript_12655/g.22988 Transcript_12655/m.22988 type:complete len:109 (-) Transcript_12655:81-407(-)
MSMHDKAPAPWHHTSSLFFGYTPTFPTSSLLDGILEYSHVWIIFQFHLNPRNKARKSNGCSNTFTASKVRPPRANGKKVGVLATRAPHRPNQWLVQGTPTCRTILRQW